MYCKKCGIRNEDDALFCKKCGASLIEEYKDDNYSSNDNKKDKTKRTNKSKPKTKVKIKNKVKKVKEKNNSGRKGNQVVVERKMGIFSKIFMFLLIVIVFFLIVICGGLGYKIYSDENIEVPDVTNMTYKDAYSVLKSKDLNVFKQEKNVTDESKDGIVLSQSKKTPKKVSKNTVIKLTVGVFKEEKISMINVVGMNIDEAKNSLNHKNILYTILYKEVDSGKDGVVLSQSIRANTKISVRQKVSIVVSKLIEKNDETSDNGTDDTDVSDDIDDNATTDME